MAAANAKIDIDNSWFYTKSGNFNFSASAQTTYDRVITASKCYFNTNIVDNPGNWNVKEGEEKKSISEISHAHSDSDIGDLHYSYAVAPQ